MKVTSFIYAGLFVESNAGAITKISNHPFPDGSDNYFYEPASGLPEKKEAFTYRGVEYRQPNYAELPALPSDHRHKFDENGNYKS